MFRTVPIQSLLLLLMIFRTVLLSIISLLNEPNTSSPANVDASVAFRLWKEGNDNTYERMVRSVYFHWFRILLFILTSLFVAQW